MTLLQRLFDRAKDASVGGTGAPFDQGPMWSRPDLLTAVSSFSDREALPASYVDMVEQTYKSNGIVFACILARLLPFSEARFLWQQLRSGRPGDLFGAADLDLLEHPWTNATTGDLLARMEQDASLAGNSYWTVVDGRLRRLRPDWVTIISGVRGDVHGKPWDLNAEILGYIYEPKGIGIVDTIPVLLTPSKVAHYAPIPDPAAQWRGMSWITPCLPEVQADSAATKHKGSFFRNGASLNVAVTYDKALQPADFERYVALFEEAHRGPANAYRTVHLGGGADAKVIGTDLKQLDFKSIQGAGETRIAAAAGVGAIIARFSEGLAGSSLNAGNYSAAKRQFADMTLRPLWRNAAGSLATILPPRPGARLWYDTRDVEFLKEDVSASADIAAKRAQTIRTLTDAGFAPESVVAAVLADDFSLLRHSGLFSVQLMPSGPAGDPAALPPAPPGG